MYLLVTRTDCTYCKQTKELLDSRGIRYAVINLDDLTTEAQDDWRTRLRDNFGHTTVPAIFSFIGSYETLKENFDNFPLEDLF